MGNDLALPLAAEETGDARAVSNLRSSCGTSLKVEKASNEDWILAPSPELTPAQLRVGVEAIERDLKGGPKSRIAEAIMLLLGATDRPPSLDEEKAAARVIALREMAWDYPIDVIEAACREWRKVPNFGRWWPTEQDLRAHCERFVKSRRELRDHATRLLHAMEAREKGSDKGKRSLVPHGRTHAFVEAVANSHGHAYVKSWLSNLSCDFTDDTIFTLGVTFDRLNQTCDGHLRKHGVRLEICPEVTKRFHAEAKLMSDTVDFGKKKKKSWG